MDRMLRRTTQAVTCLCGRDFKYPAVGLDARDKVRCPTCRSGSAQRRPLWSSLDDAARGRLFALMRELGQEAADYMARAREPPNTIPVGAALFDEAIKGAAREELLVALRTADSIEAARGQASAALREWVKKHNARRKDVTWQRWSETGQSDLKFLVERAQRAVLGN